MFNSVETVAIVCAVYAVLFVAHRVSDRGLFSSER